MLNAEDVLLLNFSQAAAKGFVLIQTKEVTMRPEDVKRVFQSNAEDLVEWITKGRRSFLNKTRFYFCFPEVFLVDSFLRTNTLSPLPLRFLLLFAVFHYPEKRR